MINQEHYIKDNSTALPLPGSSRFSIYATKTTIAEQLKELVDQRVE